MSPVDKGGELYNSRTPPREQPVYGGSSRSSREDNVVHDNDAPARDIEVYLAEIRLARAAFVVAERGYIQHSHRHLSVFKLVYFRGYSLCEHRAARKKPDKTKPVRSLVPLDYLERDTGDCPCHRAFVKYFSLYGHSLGTAHDAHAPLLVQQKNPTLTATGR